MKKNNPYHDQSTWKGAPPHGFANAQKLRVNMTNAEKLLWDILKDNQIRGCKFRRQHPIQYFIVDFYCHKLKLVIEVDGKYHDSEEQRVKDAERIEVLEFLGLEVIRFTNEEVEGNLSLVLQKIEEKIVLISSEEK